MRVLQRYDGHLQRANSFDLERLRAEVKPFRLHFFPRVGSTSDHAASLRRAGKLFAPAIVLAGRQTAGRGRGTNSWWSGAGCLTVTFVMPVEEHLAPHQIPLVAGLAVRDAAARIAGRDDILMKWPNDLIFEKRKLAGLLCERVHKADLIGLGLNVNLPARIPAGLRQRIAWLGPIAGQTLDLSDCLIVIARHLHKELSRRGEKPFAQILERYDAYHCLIGSRVTVLQMGHEPPISGQVQGLDSHGRLLLRSRRRIECVIAGQVQVS